MNAQKENIIIEKVTCLDFSKSTNVVFEELRDYFMYTVFFGNAKLSFFNPKQHPNKNKIFLEWKEDFRNELVEVPFSIKLKLDKRLCHLTGQKTVYDTMETLDEILSWQG